MPSGNPGVARVSDRDRILRHSEAVTESGCWIWTGKLRDRGGATGEPYGVTTKLGREVYAHRFAYMAFHGPIPDGLNVIHSCDVRCCVNPAHLRLGTQKENIQDASRKGRLVRSLETRKRVAAAKTIHGRYARRLHQAEGE